MEERLLTDQARSYATSRASTGASPQQMSRPSAQTQVVLRFTSALSGRTRIPRRRGRREAPPGSLPGHQSHVRDPPVRGVDQC